MPRPAARPRLLPAGPLWAVSATYLCMFGGIGVFWAHYGPFLERLGLRADQAADIIALNPLMGLLVPPLVSLLADARRARVWILRAMSLLAALAFAAWLVEPRALWAVYLIAGTYSFARAPNSALVDATAFELAHHHGTTYGRIRLWGSIGFMLATPFGGLLLEHYGLRPMVAVAAAGLLMAAASTFALPAPKVTRQRGILTAWVEMARHPVHAVYLLAVFVGFMANGIYDACFSLHLERLGHGATFIGVSWAVGVLAEIVLLHFSAAIIARLGAARLLALALGVAALRWLIVANVEDARWILLQAPLHGITFGCVFVAAATIARQRAPEDASTSSQGLFAAVSAAGSLVGMKLGGRLLVAASGHEVFLAAMGCSLVGALIASRLPRHATHEHAQRSTAPRPS